MQEQEIERKILSSFANVTKALGYSDVHGKIIGALLIEGKPLSLQELSKKINYSLAMTSLSLDFLELTGVIKKIKESGDRKLYITIDGDMIDCLRKIVLYKTQRTVEDSLAEFKNLEEAATKLRGEKRRKLVRTIKILEKELLRLKKYLAILSDVEIPRD